MHRQAGFTLIELMVVIAILGILAVTALPLYRTIQQRTYGSEAAFMTKLIIDAQIMYFLENDKFWPVDNQPILIFHSDSPSKAELQQVEDALNVRIPVGHILDYNLQSANAPGNETFSVTVNVTQGKNFPLFRGGVSPGLIIRSVDKDGKITTMIP